MKEGTLSLLYIMCPKAEVIIWHVVSTEKNIGWVNDLAEILADHPQWLLEVIFDPKNIEKVNLMMIRGRGDERLLAPVKFLKSL